MTVASELYGSVELSERDFQRLAGFIQDRSGIRMPLAKKLFLEGRIRRRLRALGMSEGRQYCDWLFNGGGLPAEETALIDAVTTNKTDFFREPHHFEFLATEVLPALQRSHDRTMTPIRIWNAGCSNGAEPYSVAMVCQDHCDAGSGFRFEIQASDICSEVLRAAKWAIYAHAAVDPVPMEMRQRYLLRDDFRDEVRIVPRLRRTVTFVHHNLMDVPYPPQHPVDILFCRNLLIYFDKPTQRKVLSRLVQCIRPGGYLVLGHSETITGLSLPLRPVAPTMFVRES